MCINDKKHTVNLTPILDINTVIAKYVMHIISPLQFHYIVINLYNLIKLSKM